MYVLVDSAFLILMIALELPKNYLEEMRPPFAIYWICAILIYLL
jgi:hypothetical protein